MANLDRCDIRQLTTAAEKGQNISESLNSMTFTDRAACTHAIEQQNTSDRSADRHLPSLSFEYASTTDGEHVLTGKRTGDPNAWFFKNESSIYDLPDLARRQILVPLKLHYDSLDSEDK
jgi:hypothetical protein